MSTKIHKPAPKKKNTNPNRKYYIAISVMITVITAVIVFFACDLISENKQSQTPDQSYNNTDDISQITKPENQNTSGTVDRTDARKVKFTMTDGQTFTMEVYPKVAPVTAENFLKLVDEGFYSGLTFHRVIAGFMAQGGAYDPVNQANNPAESIVGEFSSNGYENNLSHQRGVVSMARTQDPNSASSQFFICYGDASYLDGEYAAFGYVIEGMETVDSFLSAGTGANDVPLKEVKIKEAKIVE